MLWFSKKRASERELSEEREAALEKLKAMRARMNDMGRELQERVITESQKAAE